MAQINKPDEYFNTKLYSGTNTPQSITGVGFQPDWTWIKVRNVADNHYIYDSVRGATKFLHSDLTNAEGTLTNGLTSFNSDGFSLGDSGSTNNGSNTFVSWNWLASNTTASNTDGSITSTVSANTTNGFSIVGWTGSGANATIGHGLGVAPKVVILKDRDNSTSWPVGGDAIGTTDNNYLLLNETNALDSATTGFQSFSTTTVGLGSDTWFNGSSRNYIAYCFAEKKGFSKFGSYTGNGNADGTFVYTGFKPAWVVTKVINTTGSWYMLDNKRDGYNVTTKWLDADTSDAENTSSSDLSKDFLSNGFKMRTSNNSHNGSGNT